MKPNATITKFRKRPAAKRMNVASWTESGMDILIRAEGVELDDRLCTAVQRKIGRVRRYAPRVLRTRVQLKKLRATAAPGQFCAKVHCEIPGNDLFAEHLAHDPIAAIDLVAEKIEGRLRRRKTARLARRVRVARGRARRGLADARPRIRRNGIA